MKMRMMSFVVSLTLISFIFLKWYKLQTLDLVDVVSAKLTQSADEKNLIVTLNNNSAYDITLYFPHRCSLGELVANIDGKTITRFIDRDDYDNLVTSVVEAKSIRISKMSAASVYLNIDDLVIREKNLIDNENKMSLWLDIKNIVIIIHAWPKIRIKDWIITDKIKYSSYIGAKLDFSVAEQY